MFNMHWISEQLDLILTELANHAANSPEIEAARQTIMAVKKLLKAYSDRIRSTPYASYRSTMKINKDEQALQEAMNMLNFYAQQANLIGIRYFQDKSLQRYRDESSDAIENINNGFSDLKYGVKKLYEIAKETER